MSTLLLYVHLLAACLSIGVILIEDFALAKAHGRPLTNTEIADLKLSASRVSAALVVLWITGITLVVIGYMGHPDYLLNEKLWAKLSVVTILTINGVFLHFYSFPRITTSRGMNGLVTHEKILIAFSGSLSTTSWLFACYLGVARPWSFSVPYNYMMSIYVGLVVVAFIVAYQCLRSFSKTEEPLNPARANLNSNL